MIRDTLQECVPNPDPTEHPDYTEAEVQALRALFRRSATQRQQRLALDYFIRACGTHDQSFRPDSERMSNFAEGKRFMGTNLIWMLKTAPTKTDPDKISARSKGEQGG
ncbi:MAG: hypothetical protein IIA09_18695 [Proteobacteria bacterium]|nr:hypothetical protein [Pseudomonadota bacterium]